MCGNSTAATNFGIRIEFRIGLVAGACQIDDAAAAPPAKEIVLSCVVAQFGMHEVDRSVVAHDAHQIWRSAAHHRTRNRTST